MKIFSKYMFIALMSIIALASCGDDDKYVAGVQDSADKVGVYFPTTDGGSNEVDPADPTEFTFKVARMNTNGAVSVPLNVVSNDEAIFHVPATAEFKDGEAETTVKVTFPDAAVGTTYALTVEVPQEYISLYKENADKVSFTTDYTRVKWESIGEGYWIDGNINSIYGVNPYPLVVEIEKTVSVDGKTIRYRFDSPFAYECTGQDELGGYIGYPYIDNDENFHGDGKSHKFIVTVTKDGASLAKTNTGMSMAGDGSYIIGQIVGNLSNADGVITDTDTYPLGKVEAGKVVDGKETPGKITWPKNSLFVMMTEYNGGTVVPAGNPSILFLSAADYKAYLDASTEGGEEGGEGSGSEGE